jgi:hypothetical protein
MTSGGAWKATFIITGLSTLRSPGTEGPVIISRPSACSVVHGSLRYHNAPQCPSLGSASTERVILGPRVQMGVSQYVHGDFTPVWGKNPNRLTSQGAQLRASELTTDQGLTPELADWERDAFVSADGVTPGAHGRRSGSWRRRGPISGAWRLVIENGFWSRRLNRVASDSCSEAPTIRTKCYTIGSSRK